MKRPHPTVTKRGIPASSAHRTIHGSEMPHIRYAVGRLILDQDGERVIGFRTERAFVWTDADYANRHAVSANDPKFRFIRR